MEYVCVKKKVYRYDVVFRGSYEECIAFSEIPGNEDVNVYSAEAITNPKFLS